MNLFSILLGSMMMLTPTPAVADEPPSPPPIEQNVPLLAEMTPEGIRAYVEYKLEGNPQKEAILKTISCESGFLPQQSRHPMAQKIPVGYILQGDPLKEQSFGISQIHLPSHKVTYEEAMDVDFSLDFITEKFAEGNQGLWTCARSLGYHNQGARNP